MNKIADGTCIHHLNFLLEFLAAWEKRPECLTQMVRQWCSTISEAVGRLRSGESQIEPPYYLGLCAANNIRLRPQDMGTDPTHSSLATSLFSAVRFDRDSGGSDPTHSQVRHSLPQDLYKYLLSIILEVGFRLAGISARYEGVDPNDTPYHNRIFEAAFSSNDDEVVADAVRMWITSSGPTPLGSFARRFAKRLERDKPLSEGLRQLVVHVVEHIWNIRPWESGPETVRLLNCLDADMDDLEVDDRVSQLTHVMCGPGGLELSPRYWRLLDRVVEEKTYLTLERSDWDIMRALREVEDWEKLEVWMSFMWKLLRWCSTPKLMEDIRQVTLELLSQRPSALQKFENMCRDESSGGEAESGYNPKRVLQDICKRARAENLPSEDSSGLLYVSLQPPGTYLSVLILPFSSVNWLAHSSSFSSFLRETIAFEGPAGLYDAAYRRVDQRYTEYAE